MERPPSPGPSVVGGQEAILRSDGLELELRRSPLGLTVAGRDALDGSLVHPHLARTAAVVNAWLGRQVLQGGTVVGRDGALALLGPSGSGKSTLLAALAATGHAVLGDELVVVDAGRALAGPSSLVVRRDAAEPLRLPAGLPPAWRGSGLRIDLPPAPAQSALAGVVTLEWGEEPELRELRPAQRLAVLRRASVHGDLQDPTGLLALGDLPAWRLVRPRTDTGLGTAAALLEARLR